MKTIIKSFVVFVISSLVLFSCSKDESIPPQQVQELKANYQNFKKNFALVSNPEFQKSVLKSQSTKSLATFNTYTRGEAMGQISVNENFDPYMTQIMGSIYDFEPINFTAGTIIYDTNLTENEKNALLFALAGAETYQEEIVEMAEPHWSIGQYRNDVEICKIAFYANTSRALGGVTTLASFEILVRGTGAGVAALEATIAFTIAYLQIKSDYDNCRERARIDCIGY